MEAVSTLHERLLTHITEESDGCEDTSTQAIVDALRAVVVLHSPCERVLLRGWPAECTVTECTGCLDDGPPWPCSTITAVAEALGVEIGETPK